MGYYSLCNERKTEKIPAEYLYLEIVSYSDNYFAPKNGKRLTADEKATMKKSLLAHEKTKKILDTGKFNCYNLPVEASSIFSHYPAIDSDFLNSTLYRINPTSSTRTYKSYSSKYDFNIFEFDVVNKIQNQKDLIFQIEKDRLLNQYSGVFFNRYSCSNEGYPEIIYDYFLNLSKWFPDRDRRIILSDIVLDNSCYHAPASQFQRTVYDITEKNIRKLLDDGLVKYTGFGDWKQEELISALINCGLSEIALRYIENIEINRVNIKEEKLLKSLKLHSSDDFVKKIISLFEIKIHNFTLKITKYGEYGEDKESSIEFDDLNLIKAYLIKNYDVPFDYVSVQDISRIEHENYKFEIM